MESSRRPLSAYNLFCRFKQSKIITAEANDDENLSMENMKRLILAIPGLEDYPVLEAAMSSHDRSDALDGTADADVKQFCKLEIRNCLSKKTKYTQGISFIDINKLMSASWKALDDFYQSVFKELSEEENRKRAADDSFISPQSTPKKMKTK